MKPELFIKRLSHHTSFIETFLNTSSLHVSEIGDGNLNFVYRLSDAQGHSLIIKHAPPYLRLLGEAFKLPQNRICVEMHVMAYFESIDPVMVPKLLYCNEEDFWFAMEDLREYGLLAQAQKRVPLEIYASLGRFLASLYTHTPPPKPEGFYENATLKNISENYIFRFPHILNHEALMVPPFFTPCVKSEDFKKSMASLLDSFLNDKTSLIHGDLHTGSILIKGKEVKIIDAEFALFGPISFDIGVLFAHILFGELRASLMKKKVQTRAIMQTLWEQFSGHVATMPEHLLAQSMGFCGAELLRRLVVPSKAKALETLPLSRQSEAYQRVERLGIALVENALHVSQFEDILTLLKEHGWC